MMVVYATMIEGFFVFFIDLKQHQPRFNHDFTLKNVPKQPTAVTLNFDSISFFFINILDSY